MHIVTKRNQFQGGGKTTDKNRLETFKQKFFAELFTRLSQKPYSLRYLNCDNPYLLDIEFSVVNQEWIRCHFLRKQLLYSSDFMIDPLAQQWTADFIERIFVETKGMAEDKENLCEEWFFYLHQEIEEGTDRNGNFETPFRRYC